MIAYEDDPDFTAQLNDLEKKIPFLIKESVYKSGSHEYVTGSTMKMICKVYYDLEATRHDNGDLTVYMSLKDDYREEDEDDEEFQRTYTCEVPYDEISSLNLPSKEQEETMMLTLALMEFIEMPILQGMYIALIKRKYGN